MGMDAYGESHLQQAGGRTPIFMGKAAKFTVASNRVCSLVTVLVKTFKAVTLKIRRWWRRCVFGLILLSAVGEVSALPVCTPDQISTVQTQCAQSAQYNLTTTNNCIAGGNPNSCWTFATTWGEVRESPLGLGCFGDGYEPRVLGGTYVSWFVYQQNCSSTACPVPGLTPLTDPVAIGFENGNRWRPDLLTSGASGY